MNALMNPPRRSAILCASALLVFIAICRCVHGQGTLVFNNRDLASGINARVTLPDGSGAGPGLTAQLFGGLPGTPIDSLSALFPTTTFRPEFSTGYVFPISPFIVSSIPPGAQATFVMRVYEGSTWESSRYRGESNPFTITLGADGAGIPPSPLYGLQPFQLKSVPIPEPSTWGLVGCGVAVLSLSGWKLKR